MRPQGLFVGAATLDLHYLLPRLPDPDSKGPADRFGIYAGGPASNAAVAFAHLGGSARLYSEVGGHPLGRAIAADLEGCRVELVDLAAESTDPPMLSSIITTAGTGDRMVVASHYPDEGSGAGFPGSVPAGTGVVLVDGFLRAACSGAVAQASRRGVPVVLDAGSWKAVMEDLLPRVDYAVCSADFRPPGTSGISDVFGYLEAKGVERAVVTRGGEPILYREGDAAGEVAVDSVPVVDTLGAGDIFHGAFCYHLAAGRGFREALVEAAATATESCRTFGTRDWMAGGVSI